MKVLWFIMLWSAAIVFLLSQSSNAKSLRRSPVAKVSDDSWMKKSLQHADGMAVERLKSFKYIKSPQFTTFARRNKDLESNFKMKLFWIMVFCIAVVTLVSSKPSSLRDLTKEAPRVHKDGLIDSMKMVKRIKRSPRNNDGMDATTQPAMTATESSDPGLLGGLNALLDGIVKLLGDLLGTVL
ncbi:hypothetical protein HNY73_013916 [Argiope bruennichi]|uniref:RxLR effector protein n=1 Tax=Argiope bruennichi TaxID=94029 RepID=A0A8T0ERI7_ARGBR|nr:hypothetical protein HNY73_013916 [Argiope bruennichi]